MRGGAGESAPAAAAAPAPPPPPELHSIQSYSHSYTLTHIYTRSHTRPYTLRPYNPVTVHTYARTGHAGVRPGGAADRAPLAGRPAAVPGRRVLAGDGGHRGRPARAQPHLTLTPPRPRRSLAGPRRRSLAGRMPPFFLPFSNAARSAPTPAQTTPQNKPTAPRLATRRTVVPANGVTVPVGWSVLPLFERVGRFVASGRYQLPLFQGLPSSYMLQARSRRAPPALSHDSLSSPALPCVPAAAAALQTLPTTPPRSLVPLFFAHSYNAAPPHPTPPTKTLPP